MTTDYFRPLVQHGSLRPDGAFGLAGGGCWFSHVVRHRRGAAPEVLPAGDLGDAARARLTAPRAALAGLPMDRPHLMGILNATPDSFSDGGQHEGLEAGAAHARAMIKAGATLIDIGGESTRPGADYVAIDAEISRTVPILMAIAEAGAVLSIDTRKAPVARAAVEAGARLVNDVSGLTHDAEMTGFCAEQGLPVCIMHAQGDPKTMQANPHYEDVLLDVYDFLDAQLNKAEAQGLSRAQICVDPGIGFGKTLEHNLILLNGISLFHGLGCPILLGASRKRFIGTISGVSTAAERVHGSVAVALHALSQGVQILRVHDVSETAQAAALWQSISEGAFS